MTSLSQIRKIIVIGGVAVVILIVAHTDVSAQSRREIERERQRIERENAPQQRNHDRQYQGIRNTPIATARTEQRVNNANYSNGYQQGSQAGEYDGRARKYNRSNVYRDTGSYPNQGDRTSADYIYRQGYLQGYNDGYNGIRNY